MQTATVIENQYSLAEFQQNVDELINQVKETGQPLMLTDNGEADLVILKAENYEKLLDALEYLETIEAIREGLEDIKQGRTMPVEEFFEEMRKKHNIPEKP